MKNNTDVFLVVVAEAMYSKLYEVHVQLITLRNIIFATSSFWVLMPNLIKILYKSIPINITNFSNLYIK